MKKTFRLTLVAALAAVTAICLGIFAAGCVKDDDVKDFTVTVYTSENALLNGEETGLEVQLCVPDGACYAEQAKIDANGKATFEIAKLQAFAEAVEAECAFEVHVVKGSTTYELKDPATLSLDNKSVTVTLKNPLPEEGGEQPDLTLKAVQVTGNPAKNEYVKQLTEIIELVPVSGDAVETVLGDDGYYHLKNENGTAGAIIYVDLCNAVDRATYEAIKDMPKDGERGETVFYVFERNAANEPIAYYDYNALIATYAALCNADGLYPLNADLQKFLKLFCTNFMGVLDAGENAWLLPCKYYAESDTPVLAEGANANVTISDNDASSSFLFVAAKGGNYTLTVKNAAGDAVDMKVYNNDNFLLLFDPAATEGQPGYSADGVCGFELAAGEQLLLGFEGVGGNYTVTIEPVSNDLTIGENNVALPNESYVGKSYNFTVTEAGWFNLQTSATTAIEAISIGFNDVFSSFDIMPDENDMLICPAFYLEAGEHEVYISFGDVTGKDSETLTINETEEPKFAVGEEGNALTLFIDNPVQRALDSEAEGAYTVKVEPANPRIQLGTITLKIGDTVITLNAANNYTASAVVIPAGASVSVETDSDNFGWGIEVILTFIAENAAN